MTNHDETKAKPKRFSPLRVLCALCIAALVGLPVIRITGCAERLAYMPSTGASQTPVGAEDIWFTTADGLSLHGWFFRARDAELGQPRPAVLHLHGNAGNMANHVWFSEFLTDHSMHVMMFDYRSYGQSDKGKLRRDPVLKDAHAALDALLARDDVDPDRVGVYGVSLGGVFALPLTAQRDEVRAICTLATFSTWRGIAGDLLPVIGPLIMPSGWDPIDFIAGLADRPYIIVHGDADEVINFRHAGLLHRRAIKENVDVQKLVVPGGRHNTLLDTDPEVRNAIATFFRDNL